MALSVVVNPSATCRRRDHFQHSQGYILFAVFHSENMMSMRNSIQNALANESLRLCLRKKYKFVLITA